jgi:hypothetical protein
LQLVCAVEPRARRQALRLHLAEARSAIDRGDLEAARDWVASALAIDPQYLAAQALRDRLVEQPRVTATGPSLGIPGPTASAAVSAEGWARFEARARQRRAEKRILAAKSAIDRGKLNEGRVIMSEIREIDPAHPDLISLQMQLDAAVGCARTRIRRGPAAAAVVAFCTLLLGAKYVGTPPPHDMPAALRARAVNAPAPAAPAASAVPDPSAGIVRETAAPVPDAQPLVVEPIATPPPGARPIPVPVRGDDPAPPAVGRVRPLQPARPVQWPPIEHTQPVPPVEWPPLEHTRPVPPIQWPPVEHTQPVPRVQWPPIEHPDTTSVSPAAPPVTAAPMPDADQSSRQAISDVSLPRPELATVDVSSRTRDEDLVRAVLQQYRLAYERLDARSAAAVWPGVDSAALRRAFEGLASQRLTFNRCDVQIASRIGKAVCRGSTTYVPKIGSRVAREEPRVWTFGLRKVGDDWRIDTARAEQ